MASSQLNNEMREVETALTTVQGLTELAAFIEPLQQLLKRLEQNNQMVAVFGAFSAGKSSLLNAILGQHVLAVAPNPTTASVSKIRFGSRETVRIVAKTKEQMWQDVSDALRQIGASADSLEAAQEVAATVKLREYSPYRRKWASFLKAFARGCDVMTGRLGTVWEEDVSRLYDFTANEALACFVDSVELLHPAKVLRDGLILVDTPGVDSIHRRHSDVTFRYIREADIVVFVLYYTHAFSRADKDFLQQLANITDLVGPDKLLVVVNAADLAANSTELNNVVSRVKDELTKLGIGHAPVFALSSQLALAAQLWRPEEVPSEVEQMVRQRLRIPDGPVPDATELWQKSEFEGFSNKLFWSLNQHRHDLALSSIVRTFADIADLAQVQRRQVEQWEQAELRSVSQMRLVRQQQLESLERLRNQIASGEWPGEQTARSEWGELAFHASERIRLKFPTLFREAFYPGRFRNEGKVKTQLEDAAQEFVNALLAQMDIELRTLSLRYARSLQVVFEHLLQLAVVRKHGGLIEIATDYQSFDPSWGGSEGSAPHLPALSSDVMIPITKQFRNARHFFEEGGQRSALATAANTLLPALREQVQTLAQTQGDALTNRFRTACQRVLGATIEALTADQPPPVTLRREDTRIDEWEQLEQWFRLKIENFQRSEGSYVSPSVSIGYH